MLSKLHLRLLILLMALQLSAIPTKCFSAAPADALTTLSIEVLDTDGRPASSARVQVAPHSRYGQLGRPLDWTTLPLDKAGHADAQTTPGELVLLKASAPGRAPAYRVVSIAGRNTQEPVTLQLTTGTKLIGKLRHAGGKTVTSGVVKLSRIKLSDDAPYGRRGNMIIDYEDDLSTVTIAADGTFTADHVPPGNVRVQLDAPGFALKDFFNQVVVGVPDAESHTAEIPVLEAGYVAGMVIDSQGKPVPGVYVRIGAGEDDRITLGSTRADATGRYRVENVPDRSYYALTSHPDAKNVYTERSGINVDGVDILYVTPTKAEKRSSATAIVTNAASVGIENFTVEVIDQYGGERSIKVEFDDACGFTLNSDNLIYGRAVRVSASGYASVTHSMSAHDGYKRFILPKSIHLSGSVVDGATGEGIPDATVRHLHNANYTTITAADGTFDFPEFPSGFLELDIAPPPEYRNNAVQKILKADASETSITVPLTRAGLLKIGVVQVPGSAPVAFEPLELEGRVVRTSSTVRGMGPTRYGKTDSKGSYDHYDSGHPVTIALPQRNLKLTLPETLQPGEVSSLMIPLGSSTITIDTGRSKMVYFYGTATIDGVAYEYTSDYHRSDYLVATDLAGQATIRDLPPGQWTFHFVGSGTRPSRREGAWATHKLTVPEQGEIKVELASEAAN